MKNSGNQENIAVPGIRVNVNLVLVWKVVKKTYYNQVINLD